MRTESNQLKNVLLRSDPAYYKQLKRIALEADMSMADLMRKATDLLLESLEQERNKAK